MIFSYTFLRDEANCPHKAFRLYVTRDIPKEPPTPEMEHGNIVHKALEARIASGTPVPDDLACVRPLMAQFDLLQNCGATVKAELGLAIDDAGQPVDFWDRNAWLRGKLDVVALGVTHAQIVDWKTGKPREDPFELQIQALLLKAKYPKLCDVWGRYFWLKEQRQGEPHDLSDTERTMRSIHSQIAAAEQYAKPWPKRPNPLCGWCRVTDCEHNTREK